jgi:hypothetical protein
MFRTEHPCLRLERHNLHGKFYVGLDRRIELAPSQRSPHELISLCNCVDPLKHRFSI